MRTVNVPGSASAARYRRESAYEGIARIGVIAQNPLGTRASEIFSLSMWHQLVAIMGRESPVGVPTSAPALPANLDAIGEEPHIS